MARPQLDVEAALEVEEAPELELELELEEEERARRWSLKVMTKSGRARVTSRSTCSDGDTA